MPGFTKNAGQTYSKLVVQQEPDAANGYHEEEEEEEQPKQEPDQKPKRKRVADRVIELATAAGLELFVSPIGDTYGRIQVDDHTEVHRINSKAFRAWLKELYYARTGHGFGNNERDEIRDTLEAKAAHDGRVEQVYVRVAGHQDKLYIDLANDAWEVVEVDQQGWRVLDKSPVNFLRTKAMLPLPTPETGGMIGELREYLNFPSEDEFVLTVPWLMGAFHPTGPYPILIYTSSAGAGKSTQAKMLVALVDPRENALRVGLPDQEGVDQAAKQTWLLAHDNLSSVPTWFSDKLCTLSTGGGSSRRKLYEDEEEVLFDARRPVILTGIDELATHGDLLDRAILVHPPRITTYKRDEALWAEFNEARPRLLGAILDGLSSALADYRDIEESRFRMADFAAWATAAETGLLWEPGAFVHAHNESVEGASGLAVESSPVAQELLMFMRKGGCFEGQTRDLLLNLTAHREANDSYGRNWPKLPHRLSSELNRVAPNLQAAHGITIEKLPRTKEGQPVKVCRQVV